MKYIQQRTLRFQQEPYMFNTFLLFPYNAINFWQLRGIPSD